MAIQHINPAGMPKSLAFEAWMQRWGRRLNPPTLVVLRVAGMGMSSEVLVEIEVTAVLE